MNREPREPSRLPVRGTIATVGTVGALALLLSFRGGPLAPGESVLSADGDVPATDELIATTATETSGATAVPVMVAQTITGELVSTRFGDVQVQATLEGGDITEVLALALPDGDRHSSDISDYVEPILREEAVTIDTADVSVISGATYTSEAYALSLQSALDQAGVAAASDLGSSATTAEAGTWDAAPADTTVAADTVTLTGDAMPIRWGDVQVAVTLQGDDIIDVETLAIPRGDRHSDRISAVAEPILREEAIASDSADISVVSGATYTSRAYAASLQSALDQLS